MGHIRTLSEKKNYIIVALHKDNLSIIEISDHVKCSRKALQKKERRAEIGLKQPKAMGKSCQNPIRVVFLSRKKRAVLFQATLREL